MVLLAMMPFLLLSSVFGDQCIQSHAEQGTCIAPPTDEAALVQKDVQLTLKTNGGIVLNVSARTKSWAWVEAASIHKGLQFKLQTNGSSAFDGPYGMQLPAGPMMDGNEIDLLTTHLELATRYMEWGSGGSTIFAASFENIKHIHSLENDRIWVDELSNDKRIDEAKKSGKLHLEWKNTGPTKYAGYPVDNASRALWPTYSDLGNDRQYDLVLVDGRYRVACFLKAMRDIPGATLLFHDYVRPAYHVVEDFADKIAQDGTKGLAVFKAKPNYDLQKFNNVLAEHEYVAGH